VTVIDVNAGKLRKFDKGSVLIQEKELSRKMFVLKKGKVRVYKNYVGQKITLAILNEGEIFGEMSFFDAGPRSATVEALTPIEVYVIDAEEASRQLEELPVWVKPVLNTVFNRLRATDARATILQVSNEFEKKHFKRDSVAESPITR
jgi:CRP/FNR family transcriptional regulator, cyclic AMP receptor protein